ncbi:hypothetical protein DFH09DRAFT_1305373 [Mycena vulgaris]|nr:hypothetical protein DFH09DRAFT_1305373 [Mycena vulgaris]
MADSKLPQSPTAAGPSVRRTASIDTLPQYSTSDDARRRSLEDAAAPLPEGWFWILILTTTSMYVDMNSTPPRSVWLHPRNDELPPPPADSASISPPKRGFMGKLKEKMILSKADREAEEQQKEAKKQARTPRALRKAAKRDPG